MNPPRWLVSWAIRIYGAAIVVCACPLRARYGEAMRRTLADRCAASPSALAVLALLSRELVDLALVDETGSTRCRS